jgi:hypothetical protein
MGAGGSLGNPRLWVHHMNSRRGVQHVGAAGPGDRAVRAAVAEAAWEAYGIAVASRPIAVEQA